MDPNSENITINISCLSENERLVLKVLETQKLAQTVSNIARAASVPRTSTDYILRKFEKWKIVKQINVDKQTYWRYALKIVPAKERTKRVAQKR